jgi:hypothetical protein
MIDLVRQPGLEVAEGIVRQGSQVDDRFDSLQIPALDVAHILADAGHGRDRATFDEGAAFIQVAVEADHLMA